MAPLPEYKLDNCNILFVIVVFMILSYGVVIKLHCFKPISWWLNDLCKCFSSSKIDMRFSSDFCSFYKGSRFWYCHWTQLFFKPRDRKHYDIIWSRPRYLHWRRCLSKFVLEKLCTDISGILKNINIHMALSSLVTQNSMYFLRYFQVKNEILDQFGFKSHCF